MSFWHHHLVLGWCLHQPELHQLSLQKVSQWQRSEPIDRTPETPGSDKNLLKISEDMSLKKMERLWRYDWRLCLLMDRGNLRCKKLALCHKLVGPRQGPTWLEKLKPTSKSKTSWTWTRVFEDRWADLYKYQLLNLPRPGHHHPLGCQHDEQMWTGTPTGERKSTHVEC